MYARVTHVQIRMDAVDQAIAIYRDSVMAAAKAQKGFHATYMLTDASTGKGMSVTLWDSLEDLQASESSGYYQEQIAKFGPFLTAAPTREIFEVSVNG
jgi:heme-degrading monooxygenase HmoA